MEARSAAARAERVDPAHLQAAVAPAPQALRDAEAWRALPEVLEMSAAMESQWRSEAHRGLDAARRAARRRVDIPRWQ